MPWIDYRELRQQLEIEAVLTWMGWRANTRRAPYLRGSCPFCGEPEQIDARNFVVHTSRHIFKCFRCGEGGDILDLWKAYRGASLNAAANELHCMVHQQAKSKSRNPQSHPSQPPT